MIEYHFLVYIGKYIFLLFISFARESPRQSSVSLRSLLVILIWASGSLLRPKDAMLLKFSSARKYSDHTHWCWGCLPACIWKCLVGHVLLGNKFMSAVHKV